MGIRRAKYDTFPCSCCGFWTLTDPAYGSYEICPVCYWEDDPVQNEDPRYEGGANGVSLINARQSYIELGACQACFVGNVRAPKVNEIPPSLSSPDPDKRRAIKRGLKSTILESARTILAERLDVVENCSLIAWLAYGLDEHERQADCLRVFEVVASELDDLPEGEARNLWAPEALARKDAEASAYLAKLLPQVLDACRALESHMAVGDSSP